MTLQTETVAKVWPAPAKLNLFLHITGRRPDGYHDLQTLFQILDWGDELYLLVNDSGDISRASDIKGVPEERDICMRAAHLLKARTGVKQGVQIDLLKRIPVGAGLGGGSSDAATVLCALNELWACGLTRPELAGLGLEVGVEAAPTDDVAAGRRQPADTAALAWRAFATGADQPYAVGGAAVVVGNGR